MPCETISNREAVQMMARCKEEIKNLRAQIERLKPKADAYDNLAIVLKLHIRRPNSAFINAVIAERFRQIEQEGWSIDHDDGHLLPRQSMSVGEDLVWVLDKRMRELAEASASEVSDDR